jgi:hypothetical protein
MTKDMAFRVQRQQSRPTVVVRWKGDAAGAILDDI